MTVNSDYIKSVLIYLLIYKPQYIIDISFHQFQRNIYIGRSFRQIQNYNITH